MHCEMPRTSQTTAMLALLSTTVCTLSLAEPSWAQALAPASQQPETWSTQVQQENDQQRKATEQQIEQYKREALERERMEIYNQGQENFRQQMNNLRYQNIQGGN